MSFQIGKVKCRISFLFCAVLSFLILFDNGLVLPAFVSVCAHESAHLFAMLMLGADVRQVYAGAFGILIERKADALGFRENLLISAAGCAVNALICAAFLAAHAVWKNEALQRIAFVNFFLFLMNALPIHGLDGAQVITLLFAHRFGEKFAETAGNFISVACCVFLFAIGVIICFKIRFNPSLCLFSLYLLFESVQRIF